MTEPELMLCQSNGSEISPHLIRKFFHLLRPNYILQNIYSLYVNIKEYSLDFLYLEVYLNLIKADFVGFSSFDFCIESVKHADYAGQMFSCVWG